MPPISLLGGISEMLQIFWGPKSSKMSMWLQFRDQKRGRQGQSESLVRVFPLAFTHLSHIKAFWVVDVIIPQIFGRKICSNARGKHFFKLTADTLNHVLTFLETNLLSNWGIQCLLKLSDGFRRYAPYKPSGGNIRNPSDFLRSKIFKVECVITI